MLFAGVARRLGGFTPHFNVFCVCFRLIKLVFGGITKPTLGNASGFSGRLINTVLHENRKLDANSLRIFNNLPMAEDSIHLGSSHLFSILAEQCQTLFLLESVGAWRLPLEHLRDSRFRLR